MAAAVSRPTQAPTKFVREQAQAVDLWKSVRVAFRLPAKCGPRPPGGGRDRMFAAGANARKRTSKMVLDFQVCLRARIAPFSSCEDNDA